MGVDTEDEVYQDADFVTCSQEMPGLGTAALVAVGVVSAVGLFVLACVICAVVWWRGGAD